MYSWDDLKTDIEKLVRKIDPKPDKVFGIPRGGLVPAVYLSHKLNIPLITNPEHITPTTLVVDDICETGQTLKPYNQNQTLTLHYVKTATIEPTYYARIKEKGWIIYFWETTLTTIGEYYDRPQSK